MSTNPCLDGPRKFKEDDTRTAPYLWGKNAPPWISDGRFFIDLEERARPAYQFGRKMDVSRRNQPGDWEEANLSGKPPSRIGQLLGAEYPLLADLALPIVRSVMISDQ